MVNINVCYDSLTDQAAIMPTYVHLSEALEHHIIDLCCELLFVDRSQSPFKPKCAHKMPVIFWHRRSFCILGVLAFHARKTRSYRCEMGYIPTRKLTLLLRPWSYNCDKIKLI